VEVSLRASACFRINVLLGFLGEKTIEGDPAAASATAAFRHAAAEMGLIAERRAHGLRLRRGQHRSDWKHVLADPLLFAAKTALLIAAARPPLRLLWKRRRTA
jgi:hypothetical protein